MNPDSPQSPREQLEAKVTALLLGELSADEAANVQRAIENDPELAEMHARLQHTIGLVKEAAATPMAEIAGQPTPLRLSEARRQQLLQSFKTVKQFTPARRRQLPWAVPMSIAALLVALLSAAALLPNFRPKMKSVAVVTLSDRRSSEIATAENYYMSAAKNGRTTASGAESASEKNVLQEESARFKGGRQPARNLDALAQSGENNEPSGRAQTITIPQRSQANSIILPSAGDSVGAPGRPDIEAKAADGLTSSLSSGAIVIGGSGKAGGVAVLRDEGFDRGGGGDGFGGGGLGGGGPEASRGFTFPRIEDRENRQVSELGRQLGEARPLNESERTAKRGEVWGFQDKKEPTVSFPEKAAISPQSSVTGPATDFSVGAPSPTAAPALPGAMTPNQIAGSNRAPQSQAGQPGGEGVHFTQPMVQDARRLKGQDADLGKLNKFDNFADTQARDVASMNGSAAVPAAPSGNMEFAGKAITASTSSASIPAPPARFNQSASEALREIQHLQSGGTDRFPNSAGATERPILGDAPVFGNQFSAKDNLAGVTSGNASTTYGRQAPGTPGNQYWFEPGFSENLTIQGAPQPAPAFLANNSEERKKSIEDLYSIDKPVAFGGGANVVPQPAARPEQLQDTLNLGLANQTANFNPTVNGALGTVPLQTAEALPTREAQTGLNLPLARQSTTRSESERRLARLNDKAPTQAEAKDESRLALMKEVAPTTNAPSKPGGAPQNGEVVQGGATMRPELMRRYGLFPPVRPPTEKSAELDSKSSRVGISERSDAAAKAKIALPTVESSKVGEALLKAKAEDRTPGAAPAEFKQHLAETKDEDRRAAKPASSGPTPQPEVQTRENPFSTFSLNVADVSFRLAAASLEKGVAPEAASIRSEEFINAFDYRDSEPPPGTPIGFAWERARYPFAHNRDLLRLAVKTAAHGRQAGRALNIVLLLDNSGSMERADRIRIVREALRVLAGQLQAQDKFSVITFARSAQLRVDGMAGNQAGPIVEQLSGVTPEGGTNLEDAMNLGYQTALKHYVAGGVNRVVLLTDGAANLGDVNPDVLKQKVETHRKHGIALDCFGVGWEGLNDDLLEVLSRNGDGRYGFINTPAEAATEFAGKLAGALRVAASDVKVQVEFNPKRVTAYRQIGYAKHQLTKEQFRDNTVDAAELGAAEAGNALYTVEVNPRGDGPIAVVRVRYKLPGTVEYHEQEWPVPFTGNAAALDQSSPAIRLAASASAFSEWLAGSPFAGEVTPDRLLTYLNGVPEIYGPDVRPKKLEWMIRQAKSISR